MSVGSVMITMIELTPRVFGWLLHVHVSALALLSLFYVSPQTDMVSVCIVVCQLGRHCCQ